MLSHLVVLVSLLFPPQLHRYSRMLLIVVIEEGLLLLLMYRIVCHIHVNKDAPRCGTKQSDKSWFLVDSLFLTVVKSNLDAFVLLK